MTIIKSNKELSVKERYMLTMSPKIGKMRDVVGQRVEVDTYAIYTDNDKDGNEQTILSIMTGDGDVFATNSPTFIRDFEQLVSMFEDCGESVEAIEVINGTSKAGREFITCAYSE